MDGLGRVAVLHLPGADNEFGGQLMKTQVQWR